MNRYLFFSLILILSSPILLCAQSQAPALPEPDGRYKVDILLVVGHPDDDIVVAAGVAAGHVHDRRAFVALLNGFG